MKQERQKGILVLQYKPNFCADCPLFTWKDENDPDNEMGECRYLGEVNGGELHHRCPIKPMPSRKDNDESVMVGSLQMDIGYTLGWNDCIEEIEK